MDQGIVTTWYVSRRVKVSPEGAGHALDAMVGATRPTPPRWGALVLDAQVVHGIAPGRPSDRRIDGRLHLARRRPVRVELELAPWSSDVSELGIRPVGLPLAARGEAYFAAATASLDVLRIGLERCVAATPATQESLERAS